MALTAVAWERARLISLKQQQSLEMNPYIVPVCVEYFLASEEAVVMRIENANYFSIN